MTDDTTIDDQPIAEVVADFEDELSRGRKRSAAETAYAIAVRADKSGDSNTASEYARKSLELLEGLPSESVDQVTSTRTKVAGVLIPELLHDDVVRSRLGHLVS